MGYSENGGAVTETKGQEENKHEGQDGIGHEQVNRAMFSGEKSLSASTLRSI